jgi:putative ABC transport system permease protein
VVGVAMSPKRVAISPGSVTQDPKRFAVVWMDRAPLAGAFEMEGAFNDVVLELQPGASEAEVLDVVDRVLTPYGGFGAIPRRKQASNNVLDGELLQMKSMSTIVPAIFLAVAALLLNVVLSRLVHLQRPEIATLKAVGYTDYEIGLHFLKLVVVISGLGALLGLGTGAWLGSELTELYGRFFKFPSLHFRLDLSSTAIALAISFAAPRGCVRRAYGDEARSAEAMRPPALTHYRRSLVDLRVPASRRSFGADDHAWPRATAASHARLIVGDRSLGGRVVAGWYSDGLASADVRSFTK